jgi:hypothetical protein
MSLRDRRRGVSYYCASDLRDQLIGLPGWRSRQSRIGYDLDTHLEVSLRNQRRIAITPRRNRSRFIARP